MARYMRFILLIGCMHGGHIYLWLVHSYPFGGGALHEADWWGPTHLGRVGSILASLALHTLHVVKVGGLWAGSIEGGTWWPMPTRYIYVYFNVGRLRIGSPTGSWSSNYLIIFFVIIAVGFGH